MIRSAFDARRLGIFLCLVSGVLACRGTAPGIAADGGELDSGAHLDAGSASDAGNASLPDIYPSDGTYGWTFGGANPTAESGALTAGDGNPFLTEPGYSLAPGQGPNGIAAVRYDYPQLPSPGGGAAIYFPLPTPEKLFYARWFYKQSNPFNFGSPGAGAPPQNNQDYAKTLRMWDPSMNAIILTTVAAPSGNLALDWDSWDSFTTPPLVLPQSTWSYNANLGTWNCYEVMIDLTTPDQAHTLIWVNDAQVLDHTVSNNPGVTSATTSIGFVQFTGVVNSIADSTSTAWVTMLGISSRRMGCPPGFTFPD